MRKNCCICHLMSNIANVCKIEHRCIVFSPLSVVWIKCCLIDDVPNLSDNKFIICRELMMKTSFALFPPFFVLKKHSYIAYWIKFVISSSPLSKTETSYVLLHFRMQTKETKKWYLLPQTWGLLFERSKDLQPSCGLVNIHPL